MDEPNGRQNGEFDNAAEELRPEDLGEELPSVPDGAPEEEDDWTSITDVDLLRRAWRQEKASPEVLPYETALIERVMEQVNLQMDNIADSSSDPSQELVVMMYRMDLQRVMYLLRAYLRVRLKKIERFCQHTLSSEEEMEKLSLKEQEFVTGYLMIVEKHTTELVLGKMPPNFGSLIKQSDTSEVPDMIPMPSLETFVFCKSKGTVTGLQLDEEGDETVDLTPDDLYVLRYSPVRGLLARRQLELL
ncbi:hypothetical protein CBR_g34308 [Chara braunii]|uniref:DNA replication complex GINS protein SLD5 n=1 Tax=Chara braunii TaxID=69332 RepID=A0A388JYU0_CHABU|nr:hypothetical protein CBR_g34308 [Chara braunii]|eukprot:GBG62937.1 hypothetical protein CBR_g34308 [Chara braunii]